MKTAPQASDATAQFDPRFLDIYTGGDTVVRDQVLALFLDQSALLMKRLEAAPDERAWQEAAHSLKGCAGSVGAAHVAELARLAEPLGTACEDIRNRTIRTLRQALADTSSEIRKLLGS